MSKKRSLDIEGLLYDEELVKALRVKGLLFYEMMWGEAEDWGGLELNPSTLRFKMGALRTSQEEAKRYIYILCESLKKIIPFETNGKRYGWIRNFLKRQRLNNPAIPTLPLPPWMSYEIKEFPSKKKYAIYKVDYQKLPVDYQKTTSNTDTTRYHKIPLDTLIPQIENLLSSFPETTQEKIKTYIDRLRDQNKTKVITDGRKRTLLLELTNSRTRCNNDEIFEYAIGQAIKYKAYNIGYINAVIKGKKMKI